MGGVISGAKAAPLPHHLILKTWHLLCSHGVTRVQTREVGDRHPSLPHLANVLRGKDQNFHLPLTLDTQLRSRIVDGAAKLVTMNSCAISIPLYPLGEKADILPVLGAVGVGTAKLVSVHARVISIGAHLSR